MNRGELITAFMQQFELSDTEAADFVKAFFERIKQSLIEGDRVEIRGFGSFAMRDYQPYTGRNPKSGEKIQVREKTLPFFKSGKDMRDRVNEGSR